MDGFLVSAYANLFDPTHWSSFTIGLREWERASYRMKFYYDINCGVLQGFLAPGKAVAETALVKNYQLNKNFVTFVCYHQSAAKRH